MEVLIRILGVTVPNGKVRVEMNFGSTICQALEKLIEENSNIQFRNIDELKERYMVVLKSGLASLDTIVGDGEEISLFPFVDGG